VVAAGCLSTGPGPCFVIWGVVMTRNLGLLKIQPDIILNINNIAYVELTGKGGADVHFIGKAKALHLKAHEAQTLRNYVSGETVTDISEAA
jgi:tetrahydromethanopterin S-methyltransferase subunit A